MWKICFQLICRHNLQLSLANSPHFAFWPKCQRAEQPNSPAIFWTDIHFRFPTAQSYIEATKLVLNSSFLDYASASAWICCVVVWGLHSRGRRGSMGKAAGLRRLPGEGCRVIKAKPRIRIFENFENNTNSIQTSAAALKMHFSPISRRNRETYWQ